MSHSIRGRGARPEMALLLALRLALLVLLLAGCAAPVAQLSRSHLEQARRAALASSDPDRVGRWLLNELLAPGGTPAAAAKARARLEALDGTRSRSALAMLALGLDDDAHGHFEAAATHYLAALEALRRQRTASTPIHAWLVANRLNALRSAVDGLWDRARDPVTRAIDDPGGIGWRARSELLEWWGVHAVADSDDVTAALDELGERHGCLGEARFAGPFGRGAPSDHRRHFAAEAPAPWPARFAPSEGQRTAPEIYAALRHGCLLSADGPTPAGIYYVQSFVELSSPADVIIAVQGARGLLIDDTVVSERPTASWGIFPRYGVHLRLAAGRHRILARIMEPETTIRVLRSDGRPLGVVGRANDAVAYHMGAPRVIGDPNALAPLLDELGVARLPGAASRAGELDPADPVLRYAASYLAHLDGADDLATVLFEPLVKQLSEATPLALAQQAVFVDGDSIYTRGTARDLAKDFRRRAADGDDALWGPQVWLTLERAAKEDPATLVREMEELADRFGEVPLVIKRLARIYARLGWHPEHLATLEKASQRFPQDVDLLRELLGLYEQRGEFRKADELVERLRSLDPADETVLRRALGRRDYPAAIKELKRIGELRSDRREVAMRLADLLARAGKEHDSLARLEQVLEQKPLDSAARLALADARFAAGDGGALSDALVDALRRGADLRRLRAAIELTEGMTDLEPYRRDGLAVIREHEESGEELPGDAARVLDYAALWISRDGSARMLEHEIIRVQARAGIEKHDEQSLPQGVVLKIRTIKKDGRIFEPEMVTGKPTVTMPHLEVGDYIETESIWTISRPNDGRAFVAPRWYFREENVSYHWSELVVVAPRTRDLVIEETGVVPEPLVTQRGAFTERRWVVKGSVALPSEPLSTPIQEFLPSVRVGWGVTLDERLGRLAVAYADEEPHDPRLVRIAENIARGGLPESRSNGGESLSAPSREPSDQSTDARARRLYRWVLDNVQPGKEREPSRIITAKQGDRTRAFLHLCRLVGIDARLAVARDRLQPPPVGPFSEAGVFQSPVVRVAGDDGDRWVVLLNRFAPYGYLPSALRGQEAVIIGLRTPNPVTGREVLEHTTTSSSGADDGIVHEAEVALRADGSADMKLTQEYRGKYAIIARNALSNVGAERRKDVIEARILGMALPGARVGELDVQQLDDLDEPVRLVMTIDVPAFARIGGTSSAGTELLIATPFLPRLATLAEREHRQTPLYLVEQLATKTTVRMRITLPRGASVASDLKPARSEQGGRSASTADRMEEGELVIERAVDLPAGRVQPADYPAFRSFAEEADTILRRELRIAL